MRNTDAPKYTRHSRGDVLDAALRILDEHGLADLTMRRLAATLDVQPSALYWHFANKQTLLAAVADRIVARIGTGTAASGVPSASLASREPGPPPPSPPRQRNHSGEAHSSEAPSVDAPYGEAPSGDAHARMALVRAHADGPLEHATDRDARAWMSGIRSQADALRDALLAYRDGAEVVSSTLALGLGERLAHRRLVEAVRAGGFGERTSDTAASVLLHFVLGHVWHEQQRLQADSLGAVVDSPDPSEPQAPDAFAFGITLLIDGLASLAKRERERERERKSKHEHEHERH